MRIPPSLPCIPSREKFFQAAQGVSTSYDALIDLFERFEHYLGRLKIVTEVPSVLREVGEILVSIMVELLGVLALATHALSFPNITSYQCATPGVSRWSLQSFWHTNQELSACVRDMPEVQL